MYLPKHFEETRVEVLHELIRAYPFLKSAEAVPLVRAGLAASVAAAGAALQFRRRIAS